MRGVRWHAGLVGLFDELVGEVEHAEDGHDANDDSRVVLNLVLPQLEGAVDEFVHIGRLEDLLSSFESSKSSFESSFESSLSYAQ